MGNPRPTLTGTLFVALGGFLGATARYGVDVALPSALGATLAVNVVGSFLLGVLFFRSRRDDLLDRRLMLLIATGFVSSFTTYSTFVIDALFAAPVTAGLYVIGSYLLGFAAVFFARPAGKRLATRRTSMEEL